MIHLEDNKRKRPYDTIGGAIKFFRKRNGWTQAQLAERIGVCQSNVAHYEANNVCPPVKMIKVLSRELGCPASLLIDHKLNFTSD
jgi:transcriptional regulator with XRE-family HTH domain